MSLYELILLLHDVNTIELEVVLLNGACVNDFINRKNYREWVERIEHAGNYLQVNLVKAIGYNKYKIIVKEVLK